MAIPTMIISKIIINSPINAAITFSAVGYLGTVAGVGGGTTHCLPTQLVHPVIAAQSVSVEHPVGVTHLPPQHVDPLTQSLAVAHEPPFATDPFPVPDIL